MDLILQVACQHCEGGLTKALYQVRVCYPPSYLFSAAAPHSQLSACTFLHTFVSYISTHRNCLNLYRYDNRPVGVQIYNIQDSQSVTFESLTKLCAQAMGADFDASKLDIKFYDPKMFDFGEKKAFPMRGQHFFCSG